MMYLFSMLPSNFIDDVPGLIKPAGVLHISTRLSSSADMFVLRVLNILIWWCLLFFQEIKNFFINTCTGSLSWCSNRTTGVPPGSIGWGEGHCHTSMIRHTTKRSTIIGCFGEKSKFQLKTPPISREMVFPNPLCPLIYTSQYSLQINLT